MDIDLQPAYDRIIHAVCAEDVFGQIPDGSIDDQLGVIQTAFEKLAEVVDPEKYLSNPDDREMAWEANEKLKLLFEKGKQKIQAGLYNAGKPSLSTIGRLAFKANKRSYFLGQVIAEGDISTVHQGECVIGDDFAGRVVIKVVNEPQDNDLARNEIRVLGLLHAQPAPQWKHLPVLLDHFMTDKGQVGIVLREFDGYDLEAVHEHRRWKHGVPQKHMVWMLNRVLSGIGYAHLNGIVHGNITPSHLMIRPRDHNLVILDWSYAAVDPSHTDDGFKAFSEGFSPPEVLEKRPPLPSADIYMIGKCMIWIMGGDPYTNMFPEDIEPDLEQFIRGFVLESPLQRPQDAWALHREFNNLVIRLWGPKRFLKFPMD